MSNQAVSFVVMRFIKDDDEICSSNEPIKIFDTRKDAREYANVMERESTKYAYYVWTKGVKVG